MPKRPRVAANAVAVAQEFLGVLVHASPQQRQRLRGNRPLKDDEAVLVDGLHRAGGVAGGNANDRFYQRLQPMDGKGAS